MNSKECCPKAKQPLICHHAASINSPLFKFSHFYPLFINKKTNLNQQWWI